MCAAEAMDVEPWPEDEPGAHQGGSGNMKIVDAQAETDPVAHGSTDALPGPGERGCGASQDLAASFAACRQLATRHYENFPVLSRLLPRSNEDDFAAIYAFCRHADDAADEQSDTSVALQDLRAMHEQVDLCCMTDRATGLVGPYFPALADVICRHSLPAQPFHDLLNAFTQDQVKKRYDTWEEVVAYCTRSANPVGRLVLLITGHGERSNIDHLFELSDCTCTALQLTNFWQDVSRDLIERNRIYIPAEAMADADLGEEQLKQMIVDRQADQRFRSMLGKLIGRTRHLFHRGRGLWPHVDRSILPTIQLFTQGGEHILRAIERQGFDVLKSRPSLSRSSRALLVGRAWVSAQWAGLFPQRRGEGQAR